MRTKGKTLCTGIQQSKVGQLETFWKGLLPNVFLSQYWAAFLQGLFMLGSVGIWMSCLQEHMAGWVGRVLDQMIGRQKGFLCH